MEEYGTEALPLRAAYTFGAERGLSTEIDKIRRMEIEWDSGYTSSVRRGFIIDLFSKHALLDEFKKNLWAFGDTPKGKTLERRYVRLRDRYNEFLLTGKNPPAEVEEEGSDEFAAEADLRDYLAKNLSRIEPGLRLHEEEGRNGIEYNIEGGFIDILAVDQTGRFVVIELKVSRGRNRAVGQLLYYMGWIDHQALGKGKGGCRGMIIAKEISDDLIIAVGRIPEISLYRYQLSVSVQPVASKLNG